MDQIFGQLAPLVSEMGYAPVVTTSVSPSILHVSSGPQGVSSFLTLAEALLEDLVLLAIKQFYSMMERCIGLALSGGQSFVFLRPILENNVENIRRVGGSERAKAYEA